MTREEAIRELKIQFVGEYDRQRESKDMAIQALEQEPYEDWYDVSSNEMNLEQARRAVRDLRKKLVEHLEQEPCEDAVSREAVHEAITRWAGSMAVLVALPTREVRPLLGSIHKLPSVNPQPMMRDATPEERESMDKYIKSISKPTGVNFWDLTDGEYITQSAGDEIRQKNYDLISRQAALKELKESAEHHANDSREEALLRRDRDIIRALPSVNLQEKTGHWIEEIDDYGEIQGWYCDKCYEDSGFTTDCKWDFCPNCGVRMEDEQNE